LKDYPIKTICIMIIIVIYIFVILSNSREYAIVLKSV
jgi:hypothetical protein